MPSRNGTLTKEATPSRLVVAWSTNGLAAVSSQRKAEPLSNASPDRLSLMLESALLGFAKASCSRCLDQLVSDDE